MSGYLNGFFREPLGLGYLKENWNQRTVDLGYLKELKEPAVFMK
jgi:hypothetical protein